MPKSKKSSRTRSESPAKKTNAGANGGLFPFTNTMVESDENSLHNGEILENIQDMFSGKLDPDVVHMVLSECEWRVEEAIDTLFSFLPEESTANQPSNKLYDLAASVLSATDSEINAKGTAADDGLSMTAYELGADGCDKKYMEEMLETVVDTEVSSCWVVVPTSQDDSHKPCVVDGLRRIASESESCPANPLDVEQVDTRGDPGIRLTDTISVLNSTSDPDSVADTRSVLHSACDLLSDTSMATIPKSEDCAPSEDTNGLDKVTKTGRISNTALSQKPQSDDATQWVHKQHCLNACERTLAMEVVSPNDTPELSSPDNRGKTLADSGGDRVTGDVGDLALARFFACGDFSEKLPVPKESKYISSVYQPNAEVDSFEDTSAIVIKGKATSALAVKGLISTTGVEQKSTLLTGARLKSTCVTSLGEKSTSGTVGEKLVSATVAGEKSTNATTVEDKSTSATAVGKKSTSATAVDEKSTSATAVEEKPTSATAVQEKSTSATADEEKSTSATAVEAKPTSATAVGEKSTSATAVGEKSTSATVVREKATSATAVEEKSTSATAVEEKPTSATAVEAKPTSATAVGEKSTSATVVGEKSTSVTTVDIKPSGSIGKLSADAPEFVPRGLTPTGFASPAAVGIGSYLPLSAALYPNQLIFQPSLIDPSEMSSPATYASSPMHRPVVKRPWFKPSENVFFSDIVKQSILRPVPRQKQSQPKHELRNVQKEIVEGYVMSKQKILILLRGCPGSGKSTLARQIKFDGVILTTDDFFMRGNFYEYDKGLLGDAHQWNKQRCENNMKAGISPIIIDNTNSQCWEMKPYVLQAQEYGYSVELMEPQTKWKYKARELAKRNSHGVGLEVIQNMLQRFEYKVTVDDILKSAEKHNIKRALRKPVEGENRPLTYTSGEFKNPPNSNQTLQIQDSSSVLAVSSDADVIIESEEEIDLTDDENNDTVIAGKEALSPKKENVMDFTSVTKKCPDFEIFSQNESQPWAFLSNSRVKTKSDEIEETASLSPASLNSNIVNKTEMYKGDELGQNDINFGQTELSILADIDDKIHSIENLEQLEVLAEEFDALIYLTPLKDSSKQMLEKVVKQKIDFARQRLKSEEHTARSEAVPVTASKVVSPLSMLSAASVAKTKSHPKPVAKDGISLAWDDPVPKPQRKPRRSSAPRRQSQTESNSDTDSESLSNDHVQERLQEGENGFQEDNPVVSPSSDRKTKRKANRNRHRRPYSPLLDGAVKERFLQNSWSFQSFVDVSPSRNQLSIRTEPKHTESDNSSRISQHTNTSPRDFNVLHCVNQGYKASAIEFEFRLVSGTGRDINSRREVASTEKPPGRGVVLTLDRGTSTDDLQLEINEQFSLDFLQSCFASVPVEDLKDILSSCANDVGWTVNILLEWGYDSVQSPVERKKIALHKLRSIDDSEDGRVVLPSNVSMPPSLVDLCSQSLTTKTSLNAKELEDALIAGSEKRLEVVERLTMRTQRLLSSEAPADNSDVWIKQGAVLCSYSDSEESDTFTLSSDYNEESTEQTDSESSERTTNAWGEKISVSAPSKRPMGAFVSSSSESSVDVLFKEKSPQVVDQTESFRSVRKAEESETSPVGQPACKVEETLTREVLVPVSRADSEKPRQDGTADAAIIPIHLSVEAIRTLTVLFGPAVEHIETDQSQVVQVDYDVARTLHESLRQSLLQVTPQPKSIVQQHTQTAVDLKLDNSDGIPAVNLEDVRTESRDYDVAKALQGGIASSEERSGKGEDSVNVGARSTKKRHNKKSGKLDLSSLKHYPRLLKGHHQHHSRWQPGGGVSSFREIQEEELAKQLSMEDYLRGLEASGDSTALSTRLKRQKLHQAFPGVDEAMLEEYFEANGFSLEKTFQAVQSLLGLSGSPRSVMTDEMAARHETYLINLAKEKSLQDISAQKRQPVLVTATPQFQSFDTPDYQDFRAEANTHYQLRQECFRKAQEAFQRGMKDVASFYSRQGHLHSEKLRDANHRASAKILQYRNANLGQSSQVDLHGLHPDEAIHHLARIIEERQGELANSPSRDRRRLSVITGKGMHSRGGRAKVRPAVVNYLRTSNLGWTEHTAGVIEICLP